MEWTHILCQHNYASAPLLGRAPVGMLAGVDYDMFLKRLGAEIHRRRKLKKWNQIQFADKVNTASVVMGLLLSRNRMRRL